MVRRRLVPSRAAAKAVIAAGNVEVAGLPATKATTLVDGSVSLRLRGPRMPYVGRGGLKLEAALAAFPIIVSGRRALDVGASTGGFTDCLLQRGAAHVVALDVGYGQLHLQLRRDDRVTAVERINFRHVDVDSIGAPFDLVVADLSFISLSLVTHQLRAVGHAQTDYVLLVKPQFEVAKGDVGKGGIVRDAGLRSEAVKRVAADLAAHGLGWRGVIPSPVVGAKGNREFLLWVQHGESTLAADDVARALER